VLTSSNLNELLTFKIDSKNAEASREADEQMIKTAIKESEGFDELNKVVFKSITRCICSLTMSEHENSESQPLRDCFQNQIRSIMHQTSVELKRYEHNVEEEWNLSPPFPGGHGTEVNLFEEKEELKPYDVITQSKPASLMNTDSHECNYYDVSNDLANLCSTCLGLENNGEIINIVRMILD